MAEKYPALSPYLYCAGDLVNVVDPQGDTLLFAPGVSERFKQQFAEAVEFMNAAGTSYNIAKIHASERVYYIDEGEKSTFNATSYTIYWNPTRIGYDKLTDIARSPATVLAHEFGHAEDIDKLLYNGYSLGEAIAEMNQSEGKNDPYDNYGERRVITQTEQYAARAHGEITGEQVTRTRHHSNSGYFAKHSEANSSMSQIELVMYVIGYNARVFGH